MVTIAPARSGAPRLPSSALRASFCRCRSIVVSTRRPPRRHGVEAVLVDQVLLDVVEDVALALGRVVAVVLDAEAHRHRLVRRGLGDVALVGHPLQHVVAPRGGGALVEERVVVRGRLGQPGQQRGLAQRQPRGRLVEEDARRGLDADRRLPAHGAVGHRVDVLVDDPQLAGAARVAVLELLGQLGLADLALVAGHARRARARPCRGCARAAWSASSRPGCPSWTRGS